MKISESSLSMAGNSHLREEHIREESLRFWTGDQRPDFNNDDSPVPSTEPQRDTVTISPEALSRQHEAPQTAPVEEIHDPVAEDPSLRTMRLILESITGKKISITHLGELQSSPETVHNPEQPPAESAESSREGWGLEYDFHESHYEYEEMNFNATGSITTEDGREIDFAVQLNMTREFAESIDINVRAGDAKLVDPLVINFAGPAAELTDMKFSFDLDADGREDDISFLKPGSGFLVLDRNNDQRINDGSELFGPKTGDGFSELALFDVDHNGWLDENDPIFSELEIWTKDAAGNDVLTSLSDHDIGAISLESLQLDFQLKNPGNELQGKVKETGVFVRETGRAGTIQEIDLAV